MTSTPAPASAFTDHVPHLAHLHVADVTFAMEAAAPLEQFQAYMARMGRPDIPVYSSAGGRSATNCIRRHMEQARSV